MIEMHADDVLVRISADDPMQVAGSNVAQTLWCRRRLGFDFMRPARQGSPC